MQKLESVAGGEFLVHSAAHSARRHRGLNSVQRGVRSDDPSDRLVAVDHVDAGRPFFQRECAGSGDSAVHRGIGNTGFIMVQGHLGHNGEANGDRHFPGFLQLGVGGLDNVARDHRAEREAGNGCGHLDEVQTLEHAFDGLADAGIPAGMMPFGVHCETGGIGILVEQDVISWHFSPSLLLFSVVRIIKKTDNNARQWSCSNCPPFLFSVRAELTLRAIRRFSSESPLAGCQVTLVQYSVT